MTTTQKPFNSKISTPTLPLSPIKQFITAYGPKVKQPLYFTTQGRTKQSHKAECDINNIMARYQRTGVLEFAQKHEPSYGDVTGLDFQTAMDTVTRARSMFADLPAELRDRFHNNPGELLDFVDDEENFKEAQELGLLRPEAVPATPPTTPPGKAPVGDPGESSSKEKGGESALGAIPQTNYAT